MQLDVRGGGGMDVLDGDVRPVSVRGWGMSSGLFGIGMCAVQAGHVRGGVCSVRLQRARALWWRIGRVRMLSGMDRGELQRWWPGTQVWRRMAVLVRAV